MSNMLNILNNISENKKLTEHEHRLLLNEFGSRITRPLSSKLGNNLSVIASIFIAIPPKIEVKIIKTDLIDSEFKKISEQIKDTDPEILNVMKDIKDKLKSNNVSLLSGAYAELYKKTKLRIVFTLLCPDTQEENFINYLSSSFTEHNEYYSFIYLHELFHILERDLEFSSQYCYYIHRKLREKKMTLLCPIPEFLNIAADYHINYKLLKAAPEAKESIINKDLILNKNRNLLVPIFDDKYNGFKLTRFDIIDMLLKDSMSNPIKIFKMGSDYVMIDSKGNIGKFSGSGNIETMSKNNEEGEGDTDQKDPSNSNEGLDNSLKDIIRNATNDINSTLKGSGSSEIFKNLGYPLEIKLDWFKLLKTKVKTETHRLTKDYDTTWSRPNIFKKHIALIPGKKYLNEKPEVIISVDSSGSVDDKSVRKINYIIESLAKKKIHTTILIHDTKIVKIIECDRIDSNIKELVTIRYAVGGTSHKPIFDYVRDNCKNKKKTILILCSDFHSDVANIKNKYDWISEVKTISVIFSRENIINHNECLGDMIHVD